MWIVDSSVWIDYFNGVHTPATHRLDEALGKQELGIGDIILCEVLQGFRQDGDFERARRALLNFPVFTIGGADLAIQSARNYRLLRQKGVTIRKTIDCLIATYVIENGYTLLYQDRDFDPFVIHLGLQVA